MTVSAGVRCPGATERRLVDIVGRWLVMVIATGGALASALLGAVNRAAGGERRRLTRGGDLPPTASESRDVEPSSPRLAASTDAGGEVAASTAGEMFSERAAYESVAGERDGVFLPVAVPPWFCPRLAAEVCAQLATPPMAKLLDLTPAQTVDEALFRNLAAAWTAPATAVPRLGILLPFDRWAAFKDAARVALRPVAERGIRLQIFYAEQAWGGQIASWFRYGTTVHNLPAAIATLGRRWEPSATWPAVIDTLARLVRVDSYAAEIPALLTEIAELALSCGDDLRAELLAREALFYLDETVSVTGSKARRVLGTALMARGQSDAATALHDEAIEMAAVAKAPWIEASALCQSGLFALNHGNPVGAEQRFRRAIALLAPSPHLLAVTHHHLAIALMHQGRHEAEDHARTALALRLDPHSHLAEADRILLARLRAAATQRANE